MDTPDVTKRTFAHLVNPLTARPGSDLVTAQPITFAAVEAAVAASSGLSVELLAAVFEEDASMVPRRFARTRDLERSVLDVGTFTAERRMPILADLLERGHESSTAEWLIFSNVDIAPLPHFYRAIGRYLSTGHDALIINRRTISAEWTDPADLPLMYAEVGTPHPGFDCFVFPRRWVPEIDTGEICVGARRVGLSLVLALYSIAEAPRILEHDHLTFHIGDDGPWRQGAHDEFNDHNTAECRRQLERLTARHGPIEERLPARTRETVRLLMQGRPTALQRAMRKGNRLLGGLRRRLS